MRAGRYLLWLAMSLSLLAQGQEQGQYRSRIMLDPLGELGKGSELSTAELEQQIDGIRDPYARSSATRHLARHYVQQQDYDSAIGWYREALAARGLSAIANRDMLRELGQVYLLAEDYREAAATFERALALDLVPASTDFLMLAQAYYRSGSYVPVVASLDRLQAAGLPLDTPQLKQALALYYRAGAFAQCEGLLRELLRREPGEASHWHHLASVYLQQNKRRQALDQLVLARAKGIPFTVPELSLLVDLQAVTGNPYGAAETLSSAMSAGELPRDAANQRKLFELWLQARERQQAASALAEAARLSGDPELYLYLAQLQLEDEHWQALERTLLQACQRPLPERHVSRANLLLGISQLKQDRPGVARRLLVNATLLGGANAQAGEWLRYMDAAPATEDEKRRERGPCVGAGGQQASLEKLAREAARSGPPGVMVSEDAVDPAPATQAAAIERVEVPAGRFFAVGVAETLLGDIGALRNELARLNVNLIKAGGQAMGSPQLLRQPDGSWLLAQPLRGAPEARGRYRVYNAPALNAAVGSLPAGADAPAVIAAFVAETAAAGLVASGELRLVLPATAGAPAQILLGIK